MRGLIIQKNGDERLAFGWAYMSHDSEGNLLIDKQGDLVDDPKELENAAYRFVVDSRTGGVMHMRNAGDEPHKIGTMVESFVSIPDKIEKMGISGAPTGWWVGFRVEDDKVWDLVKREKLAGFSIHGTGRRVNV